VNESGWKEIMVTDAITLVLDVGKLKDAPKSISVSVEEMEDGPLSSGYVVSVKTDVQID
jgi:hypothetical protein